MSSVAARIVSAIVIGAFNAPKRIVGSIAGFGAVLELNRSSGLLNPETMGPCFGTPTAVPFGLWS